MVSNIFNGIDFMDSKVQSFFLFLILAIFLLVIAMFSIFKLFIPKSKMQNEETLDKAIHRLKKLMLFDKIVLCISVIIIIVSGYLYFTGRVDVSKTPFIWITGAAIAISPIFIVAVYGGGRQRISSNQRKLNQLIDLKKKSK